MARALHLDAVEVFQARVDDLVHACRRIGVVAVGLLRLLEDAVGAAEEAELVLVEHGAISALRCGYDDGDVDDRWELERARWRLPRTIHGRVLCAAALALPLSGIRTS